METKSKQNLPVVLDLLTELALIWNEAEFGEDDMSADLGDRLIEIQDRVERVMENFGYPFGLPSTLSWPSDD